MASNPPQPPSHLSSAAFAAPASPRTMRTIRKIQSLQTLSSTSSGGRSQAFNRPTARIPQGSGLESSRPGQIGSLRRARSSSATGLRDGAPAQKQSRSSRRSGFGARRSVLETLLRDGPPNGNLLEGLQELRYLVLSARVDADTDGMSPYRIYLWLALLDIPPLPTDEYLSLVHRGRSPAYQKIRNDTFRTLATDNLFKRRVTEASLIRLLNAVAWKIHDTINPQLPSVDASPRRRSRQTTINPPPKIVEEDEFDTAVLSTGSTQDTSELTEYVQGMNVMCAPFLYAARSEVEAFALFHHFVTRECPAYVRSTMDGVHRGVRLVDRCLEIIEPKLASYLFSKGMHAELYAFPSVLTFCACTPPLPQVLHLWDFLFAYGPHLNILCIVAQLIRMRDTLLNSPSPNKILRSFPLLDAKEIIALTVLIVRKIPDDLYVELVKHAK